MHVSRAWTFLTPGSQRCLSPPPSLSLSKSKYALTHQSPDHSASSGSCSIPLGNLIVHLRDVTCVTGPCWPTAGHRRRLHMLPIWTDYSRGPLLRGGAHPSSALPLTAPAQCPEWPNAHTNEAARTVGRVDVWPVGAGVLVRGLWAGGMGRMSALCGAFCHSALNPPSLPAQGQGSWALETLLLLCLAPSWALPGQGWEGHC